ncbi:hypothetical protein P152DRAFT_511146 [Eremomyces bilateralis CBS 781.70]|uniref:Protein FAM118B n=1 Tax=Eremomyces bilateralis CBS 781.70 TaxID=1392243 RepID=A0A6G1GER4_9PEZI|nr:uncharacterized protein P152DRAFT_511146 [Eremomyces bilateralis CBS 781.70]KAF1816359.1 hypothetical protein P152DRAFT_511146 [Eremomyces bilateralis CBS 781.70]
MLLDNNRDGFARSVSGWGMRLAACGCACIKVIYNHFTEDAPGEGRIPSTREHVDLESYAACGSIRSRQMEQSTAEEDRVQLQTINRLKESLRNGCIAIIVGAGITINATVQSSGHPLERITWNGLVKHGLDYLVTNQYVDRKNRQVKCALDLLESEDTEDLLLAAHILREKLDRSSQLPTWLESVFGDLYGDVRYPAILDALRALHKKRALLLTTNYDDLLEKHCELPRIGRSSRNNVAKFRRGELDGVFHVHGSFHDPEEVVLGSIDYFKVKQSEAVQDLLRTYLQDKTILFVGCGSGLEDPNFNELLRKASEQQRDLPNRHCLLIRDGDSIRYNPLVSVKYGSSYGGLAPFLHRLASETPDESMTGEVVSLSDHQKEILLKSLRFDQMDARQMQSGTPSRWTTVNTLVVVP